MVKRGCAVGLGCCVYILLVLAACFAGTSEAGVKLSGWKDMNPLLTPDGSATKSGDYQYVLFGRYPQEQTMTTPLQPIVWRILSADQTGEKRKALLLSDKNLDAMAFGSSTTYAGSTVDTFLKTSAIGKFYNGAYFTSHEKASVAEQGFTATKAMFLLSIEEAKTPAYGFLNGIGADVNRVAANTAYATGKGAGVGIGLWWTRSEVSQWLAYVFQLNKNGEATSNSSPSASGVAVRPAWFLNLESLIFKSGSDTSSSAAAAGSRSNPYLLFATEVSIDLAKSAAVDGDTLTLSLDMPDSSRPDILHAYAEVPDATALMGRFTVSGTMVTGMNISGDTIILTLQDALVHGDADPALAYVTSSTDGIGFIDTTGVPTTLAVFAGLTVDNVTAQVVTPLDPDPDSGTDPNPDDSTETTPSGVSITLGGTVYQSQVQPDGTYLITLSAGTNLSAIKLGMTLPAGATISPSLDSPFDFTEENPRTFTITAEDGTTQREISIKIAVDQANPTEKPILAVAAGDCAVTYTLNEDGSVSVGIQIPFSSAGTVPGLENLAMTLRNNSLSGINFAYVNAEGASTPYSRRARSSGTHTPHLRITGRAASMDSIASESITSISYRIKGSEMEYVQTFSGDGLKFSGMDATDNTEANSSGGGCDTGGGTFGLGALTLSGAVALMKKRKEA